jgi:chloride channel core
LKLFEQTHLPAFPVVWKNTGRLDGVLYRNALFQVITEMMKRESGGDVGM